MATRSIVPINDNEGGIGTVLKRWASGFFNVLRSASHYITDFTVAGFVKNDVDGLLSGGEGIQVADLPSGIDATKIGAGGVSSTMFGYLAGVTSAIQTQINGKFGSVKVGTFTRDMTLASGTQAVTGVGFVPRVILFLSVRDSVVGEVSVGFDNIIQAAGGIGNIHNVTAYTWEARGIAVNMVQAAGVYYQGDVASFDADGFTISWTKGGAKTGTVTMFYLALG